MSECIKCGGCCMTLGTPPFMPDEREAMEPCLREIVDAMYTHWDGYRGEADVPCYFLNTVTRECRIYDERPGICQEFEPDSESCVDFRAKTKGRERNE